MQMLVILIGGIISAFLLVCLLSWMERYITEWMDGRLTFYEKRNFVLHFLIFFTLCCTPSVAMILLAVRMP